MTTDPGRDADHRLAAAAAYGIAARLRGQARDLLSQTHRPGSSDAASSIVGSVAETVRAFEETLRELAFRAPDVEATARLDAAAGRLASGRVLTEDASALLADTGPGSGELAELRAAGLVREVPGPEPAQLGREGPVSAETFDRYTRGLPPGNPAEQILISRLAASDFSQAWEQARDDHLFPPPGTSSPGHSSCQPGTCPFDGPVPEGPAAAAAARNLAEQIREDHFAHGTAIKEPGPHYAPAHQESTCPWDSATLPPVERAARALAREHVTGIIFPPAAAPQPGTTQRPSPDFPVSLTERAPSPPAGRPRRITGQCSGPALGRAT